MLLDGIDRELADLECSLCTWFLLGQAQREVSIPESSLIGILLQVLGFLKMSLQSGACLVSVSQICFCFGGRNIRTGRFPRIL